MGGLILYSEKKQQLSEVGFVKDTLDQVKIRNINNSYELKKQLGIVLATSSVLAGIKSEISKIQKQDVVELILMRFKNLSLDEIAYAFKLERYNGYEFKTDHFQQFNADYVSSVLDKYVIWKRNVKKVHQISTKRSEKKVSDQEKQYWINKGVLSCFEYWRENEDIEDSRIYVYDVLYDMDFLQKGIKFKKKMYESAREALKIELNLFTPNSKEDYDWRKKMMIELAKPKSDVIKTKAKKMVLSKFFRELKDVERFLNKFNNNDYETKGSR